MPAIEERAKRVYEACASLIGTALRAGWNEEAVVRVAEKIATLLDSSLGAAQEDHPNLDCKPKCTFCCHRMITAQPVELIRIWSVVSKWPAEQRVSLQTRIGGYEKATAPDRPENFRRSHDPCPFLTDGLCSIYEDRPAMCRTACSLSAGLCQALHEDPEALRAYSPNGESEIARAALRAMFDATRPFGPPVYLQLSSVVGRLLANEATTTDLLNRPASFHDTQLPPWDIRIAPAPNSATANAGLKGDAAKLMEKRASGNSSDLAKFVDGSSTSQFLARIDCPMIYETAEEIPRWRSQWEKAIEEALQHEPWNAADAYHDLTYLRPIKAGYSPYEMRRPMQQLGQIICEKTAKRVAPELCEPIPHRKPGKARLGFLGNIGSRAGTSWSIGWVQNLNKTEIESFVLNVGHRDDAVTYAFKDAADHYLQLRGDPLEIARYIRNLDLDYLIYCDLGDESAVYQQGCFRLARRQAASWGCPFTSGLPTMDDYLSFDFMEPAGANEHYSENLVRLPGIGIVLSPPRPNRVDWGRKEFGLPPGFLAIFPQNTIKWLPHWDWMLAEIASRSKNPIVMIRSGDGYRQQVFDRRMEQAKVPVLWLERQQRPMFLRLLTCCDVALDAPDWSGGLTAIDCFSQRTPFITLPGPYFRHRLGVGIARKAGGDGLIAASPKDYLDLATNRDRIQDAMKTVDPDRLYQDLTPLRALEDLVLGP